METGVRVHSERYSEDWYNAYTRAIGCLDSLTDQQLFEVSLLNQAIFKAYDQGADEAQSLAAFKVLVKTMESLVKENGNG